MRRPIRVLELRSVWGTGGGPEKTILLGAKQADKSRFAVTVCYLRDNRDKLFGIDEQARRHGIDYLEIRERHSFDPGVLRELTKLVRERKIDIVHAHEYKTDLLSYLLARRMKIIPLATVHGWTGNSWREKFYYAFDKRLLSGFPCLIAVSSEIRKELLRNRAVPERVKTLLNGIDPEMYRRDRGRLKQIRNTLGMQPGELVIGAIGRLERQKRFDVLLESFATARRENPLLKLLIVGEGSLRRELESFAGRLRLGSAIQFLGHRTDIIDIHHALDLFVQSSDYEGTSNAVLEAMAMETPIVATAVGGTAELVRDRVDGLLIPPGNSGALADAIVQVLADPEGSVQRCRSARKRVEESLSFAVRTRALERIYEGLMERMGGKSN